MAIGMWLKKILTGHVVLEEVESSTNGKIRVLEDILGKIRVMVGDLAQSGDILDYIWLTVIKKLKNQSIKRCLILGLGAGSAVRVTSRLFPGIRIYGVEIDPEMIRLGRQYFSLDEARNLKVINTDAVLWLKTYFGISHYKDKRGFDLILVDIFLGDEIPVKAKTNRFLRDIKRVLNPEGTAIFNRLYYGNKKKETDDFGKRLKGYFSEVEPVKVLTNKLFLCRNTSTKHPF